MVKNSFVVEVTFNDVVYLFGIFFVFFYRKIYVFMIFISFFDEVSNFHNRMLTSQKRKLVVSNCQWSCMFYILRKYQKITDFLMFSGDTERDQWDNMG